MTVFPVIASVLDAEPLGEFISEKYNLKGDFTCSLFRTGINHTYFLVSPETKYVLRVYSLAWRSKAEILEEINFLLLLRENGVGVSFPIVDPDANFIQEIQAPEGLRYAVLFSFAKGGKIRFMGQETCFAIGKQMARMHSITENKSISRIDYNLENLINLPYKSAQKYFSDSLPEMVFVREIGEKVGARFESMDKTMLRKGIVHLDMWYDNMNVTDENEVTVFDFDFCGNGWLVLDIAYFCMQLFHIETNKKVYESKKLAFLNGYKSILGISEAESKLISEAGAAIWIFYLGVQCQRFDWSNVFLSENYLKHYIGRLKVWLEYSESQETMQFEN